MPARFAPHGELETEKSLCLLQGEKAEHGRDQKM